MANIDGFSVITNEVLLLSGDCHNRLPEDDAIPEFNLQVDGMHDLCNILVKYNAHQTFGLRILHQHATIAEGQIMLSSTTTKPDGFWTRPVDIAKINDISKLSGWTFAYYKNIWQPFEFREGYVDLAGSIESNFFVEFSEYIKARGWEEKIGLEAIHGYSGQMVEFSFDIGNLLLKAEEVKVDLRGGNSYPVQTGFRASVNDGIITLSGETRCITSSKGHSRLTSEQIEQAGREGPFGLSDALGILRNEGILVK